MPYIAVPAWRAAELHAAEAMRAIGYRDADVTPMTRDGGVDVISSHVAVQVKDWATPVGWEPVADIAHVAEHRALAPAFVAPGYTPRARVLADQLGVALFSPTAKAPGIIDENTAAATLIAPYRAKRAAARRATPYFRDVKQAVDQDRIRTSASDAHGLWAASLWLTALTCGLLSPILLIVAIRHRARTPRWVPVDAELARSFWLTAAFSTVVTALALQNTDVPGLAFGVLGLAVAAWIWACVRADDLTARYPRRP